MQNRFSFGQRNIGRRAAMLLGLGAGLVLTACEPGVILRPGPRAMAVIPDGCVEITDPALRAQVLTRLSPSFRGPRGAGGRRITLEEYLTTRRHRVFDCGDVWRVVFTPISYRYEDSFVVLRKDGVVLYYSFD